MNCAGTERVGMALLIMESQRDHNLPPFSCYVVFNVVEFCQTAFINILFLLCRS